MKSILIIIKTWELLDKYNLINLFYETHINNYFWPSPSITVGMYKSEGNIKSKEIFNISNMSPLKLIKNFQLKCIGYY